MENEFYITGIKETCVMMDVTTYGSVFSEKMPGLRFVKIKLESAAPYDIEALNAALAAGKKVKLVICE